MFRAKDISSDEVNTIYSQQEWYDIMQNRFVMQVIELSDLTNLATFTTRSGNTMKVFVDPDGLEGIYFDWNGDYNPDSPDTSPA